MCPDFQQNKEAEKIPQESAGLREITKEVPVSFERKPEQERGAELPRQETFNPQPAQAPVASTASRQIKTRHAVPISILKEQEVAEIEKILEEHVQELFIRLPENRRQVFKQKGEETAKQISILLHETTVKVQKIIILIITWLRVIPGINKFFIEQEAAIKANRLLALKEKQDTSL